MPSIVRSPTHRLAAPALATALVLALASAFAQPVAETRPERRSTLADQHGFPPDFPTWGRLLFDAVDQLQLYPNRVMLPGIAISLTVLSVNYIGDGLRDALDPWMKK